VSIALINLGHANVVAEVRLIPGDHRGSVLGNHPQISGAVLHYWWFLVNYQLLTIGSRVAHRTLALSAEGGHITLHSTGCDFITRPIKDETRIENWFRSAVAHLFLDLRSDVEGSSPNLSLSHGALEAGIRIGQLVGKTIWLWTSQHCPEISRQSATRSVLHLTSNQTFGNQLKLSGDSIPDHGHMMPLSVVDGGVLPEA